ncbi:MAG: type IX secretion system protein PorQ [Chlorobi bacterium]|nr:type IX secretion system protein PorQ [Chlorobiota bacterium]
MRIGLINFITVLILSFPVLLRAQQGGDAVYEFLNLTNSARIAALGGNQVGLSDNDLNLVFHNPAALNDTINGQLVLNYVPYLSDINYGYAAYAQTFERIGTFSFGIHYINYGTFDRADEYGNINGSFSAGEYAFLITYARQLSDRFNAGITMKPIISNFERYNSFGFAFDVGFMYSSASGLFNAGVTLKNFGAQLTTYNETTEPLPTDLQAGMSIKLAHAPFRFSITAQDLLSFDLTYTLPDNEESAAIDFEDDEEPGFGDKFMRHMIFGMEFIPSKNFYVSAGYNHRRRKELTIDAKSSTVGFSWGFGFRVYKFRFSYGSARYHLAGSSNHFSISTNLSSFSKKR